MQPGGVPQVTFFTRAACHLCDAALFELRHALAGADYVLAIVDIDVDRRWRAAYDLHVPVIWVNGAEICRHRADRQRVRAAVSNAARGET